MAIDPNYPTFEAWEAAAKAHAMADWNYYCEHYSFHAAFDEGMGPLEAVADCAAWLED